MYKTIKGMAWILLPNSGSLSINAIFFKILIGNYNISNYNLAYRHGEHTSGSDVYRTKTYLLLFKVYSKLFDVINPD